MSEPEQVGAALPPRRAAAAVLGALARAVYRMRAALHLWPLLLPVLILIPAIPAFPYPSAEALYSDITVSHYPNAVYLIEALREWRSLPLWSPAILSGHPFFADPLAGIWYPPGWLALLLPLPAGFNLMVILHLLWGGIGMYFLLRSSGCGHAGSLVGALAFQSMPKLFAHYGAGHLTLIYALSWTPWLLLAERQPAGGSTGKRWAAVFRPGVVLALIFLADARWAAFSLVLWWGYAIAHSQQGKQTFSRLFSQAGIAALLSAPLALPLLEYSRLSTRAALSAEEVLAYSMPLPRLLGLVFPDFGGYHEWVLYPGAAVLALGLSALVLQPSHHRKTFWIIIFSTSVLVSMGSQIPFLSFLAGLPGVGLLRVPARALFLAGFALAFLAAMAVDRLLAGPEDAERRRVTMLLTGLCGFALALAAGVWFLFGGMPLNFAWGAGALLLAALWVSAPILSRLEARRWLAGLLLLVLLDLGVVNALAFAARAPAEVYAEGEAAASYLSLQPGTFRIYSPSYSLPQHTASRYRLDLVDGVNPLQLERYAAFMERASGVPRGGYSVTIPSFQSGRPQQDNAGFLPDPELLGLLNAQYVLAEYDLDVTGLVLRERFGETRVYENIQALPRAWIQPAGSGASLAISPVEFTRRGANHITVIAAGAGQDESRLLVISELVYPGWRAYVDGEETEIQAVAGLLRGVTLEPGQERVDFLFRPLSLFSGLALWVLGAWLVIRGATARGKQ